MSEFKQALDFIERVENSAGLDELSAHLGATLENFGVPNFTMLAMVAEHDGEVRVPRVLVSRNNDDWERSYRERKLYNSDPTVHASLHRATAFSWSDIEKGRLSKEARTMFAEIREAMPIDGGLLIPTHDEEGCAGLIALYHEDKELTPKARQALKLISIYAVERAKELLALQEIGSRIGVGVCPLTGRQREILSHVAAGKSDWDISVILNIASSTVNEHIENAKEILCVKTRAQAVAIAVKRGWIIL